MVKTKNNNEIKKEIPTQICPCCGKEKKINGNNFYKSYSFLYQNNYENRMSFCKSCVEVIYDKMFTRYGTNIKALYETCRTLDVYYDRDLYDSVLKQCEKQDSNKVINIYMQKVNSLPQYKGKSFVDSSLLTEEEMINDDGEVEIDSVDFWGTGLSANDYKYLNKEYKNLLSRYECDSYSQEVLFQEIAQTRLDIKKKRASNSSVKDELKTLQDLMGNANIKPVQENESLNNEQVTFGTLIKKYENEKPIPEPLSEWKSKDWIRKYVVVWFFGNLCRMMGKENPYKDEYNEEMDKYTVKVDEDYEE